MGWHSIYWQGSLQKQFANFSKTTFTLDFVGAQLITPYTDHATTIKDIKVLAENRCFKFGTRKDLKYHFEKHKNEYKECREHSKSIFYLIFGYNNRFMTKFH